MALTLAFLGGSASVVAGELTTLFTTPQEREIINANRYQKKTLTTQSIAKSQADKTRDLQLIYGKDKTVRYQISGITLSADGRHSVWINQKIYADGAQLDDTSKIKVLAGKVARVRITAPDGKHYYATSGDALEVSYRTPADID